VLAKSIEGSNAKKSWEKVVKKVGRGSPLSTKISEGSSGWMLRGKGERTGDYLGIKGEDRKEERWDERAF